LSQRSLHGDQWGGDGEGLMTDYLVLKYAHIIGATVLLGTGAGIAFFMLMAHLSRSPAVVAAVARIVVIADFIFTASAVAAQPITGALLARSAGYPLTQGWIVASIGLYILTGAFWLPVVWMQMRMHRLAQEASAAGAPLPVAYHVYFRWWFAFGIPAFASVLMIFWLMVARPSLF
jgi:uncharacterized membrane protein